VTLKLLVAEDDPSIAKTVVYGLRMMWPDGQVTVAADGAEALQHFAAEQPDVVVLDVTMPPPDGLEVCQRIREVSQVPILMLTVHDSTMDKIRALDLGADDYLTKPFDPLELLARLRALLRRTRAAAVEASTPLAVGDVALDPARHEVRVRGTVVPLTSTEYRLLEEFMRHAGRVLPHQYLLTAVWGPEYAGELHYLRVFVARLRQKLGDDPAHPRYIQTEWHTGYRFASSP
jgi:two-component system KDP operon response regulator KdpE